MGSKVVKGCEFCEQVQTVLPENLAQEDIAVIEEVAFCDSGYVNSCEYDEPFCEVEDV